MVACDWAVFCDYAFEDNRGKLCLIGLFQYIHAASFPANHQTLFFVVLQRNAGWTYRRGLLYGVQALCGGAAILLGVYLVSRSSAPAAVERVASPAS